MYSTPKMLPIHGVHRHRRGRFFMGPTKKFVENSQTGCRPEESSGLTMFSLSHFNRLGKVVHHGQGVVRLWDLKGREENDEPSCVGHGLCSHYHTATLATAWHWILRCPIRDWGGASVAGREEIVFFSGVTTGNLPVLQWLAHIHMWP